MCWSNARTISWIKRLFNGFCQAKLSHARLPFRPRSNCGKVRCSKEHGNAATPVLRGHHTLVRSCDVCCLYFTRQNKCSGKIAPFGVVINTGSDHHATGFRSNRFLWAKKGGLTNRQLPSRAKLNTKLRLLPQRNVDAKPFDSQRDFVRKFLCQIFPTQTLVSLLTDVKNMLLKLFMLDCGHINATNSRNTKGNMKLFGPIMSLVPFCWFLTKISAFSESSPESGRISQRLIFCATLIAIMHVACPREISFPEQRRSLFQINGGRTLAKISGGTEQLAFLRAMIKRPSQRLKPIMIGTCALPWGSELILWVTMRYLMLIISKQICHFSSDPRPTQTEAFKVSVRSLPWSLWCWFECESDVEFLQSLVDVKLSIRVLSLKTCWVGCLGPNQHKNFHQPGSLLFQGGGEGTRCVSTKKAPPPSSGKFWHTRLQELFKKEICSTSILHLRNELNRTLDAPSTDRHKIIERVVVDDKLCANPELNRNILKLQPLLCFLFDTHNRFSL